MHMVYSIHLQHITTAGVPQISRRALTFTKIFKWTVTRLKILLRQENLIQTPLLWALSAVKPVTKLNLSISILSCLQKSPEDLPPLRILIHLLCSVSESVSHYFLKVKLQFAIHLCATSSTWKGPCASAVRLNERLSNSLIYWHELWTRAPFKSTNWNYKRCLNGSLIFIANFTQWQTYLLNVFIPLKVRLTFIN